MFERFTERARQVVVLAQDEARSLGHDHIDTEHTLLGLLREEEGLASRVLASLDITVDEVRAQVVRLVGRGDETIRGQIPFTPRAKKVLELSLREALSLGHTYIGTEHILLGLVRENGGVAARILADSGADAERIRNEIIRMLSGPGRRPPEKSGRASTALGVGERFTGRGRLAVVRAEDEARGLKHNYIGTEHILLGLLRVREGLAARVLESVDIDVGAVRARVAVIVGEGDEAASGPLPMTPRAKRVLELALREALALGQGLIGTGHILLGLVRECEGVAARVLVDFDADPDQVRNEVLQIMNVLGALPADRREPGRPPLARGARVPRWEYRVERWRFADPEGRARKLNRLGAQGWQLAGTLRDDEEIELIFQRPRPGRGPSAPRPGSSRPSSD